MTELVTIGLFVYNHEKFVCEAIEAIYAQTYRPLELIVSEDASADGSRAILDEMLGRAPAGIQVTKVYQDYNKGLANVVNAVTSRANGKIIIFAAGDDVSEPNRVATLVAEFSDTQVMFVHSGHSVIDGNSRCLRGGEVSAHNNLAYTLNDYLGQTNPAVLGATCAYRKKIFEYFSPLKNGIIQEDVILPFRALLLGVGRCVAHPLVRYRTHGGNISFGGLDADSSEIVRRIVRLQKNRFLLALSQVEDLNLHSANGAVVSDALIKYQAVNLAEAELEDRIASGKNRIVKTAYILKCILCLRLRFAAAAWLLFIYVIPRGYAFALWIRKKQRLLS